MGMNIRVAARHQRANLLTLRMVNKPYDGPSDEDALCDLVEYWADQFLDLFVDHVDFSEHKIEHVLHAQGLTAEKLNELNDTQDAGVLDTVHVLGGLVVKKLWHMTVHSVTSVWKFITSSKFRHEVKISLVRAVKHEARSSKHLMSVAGRLARGEDVNPHERKAAMHQLVDIFKTALMIHFMGPHVAHILASGFWKALASLGTPFDEIVGMLIDAPIRFAANKMLGMDIGLLPSGFYTHW
jgi:hypothetical protein